MALLTLISACGSESAGPTFGGDRPALSNADVSLEVARERAEVALTLGMRVDERAIDAVAGYLAVRGEERDDGGWRLDLAGLPRPAERAAFGLLDARVRFERSGDDGEILEGDQTLADVVDDVESARSALGRRPDLLVASVSRRELTDLLESDARDAVATLVWSEAVRIEPSAASWMAATTGSPVPGAPLEPPSAEGGISWSNREAQAYVPARISFPTAAMGEITITAIARTEPDVSLLPFESGMVLSRERFRFGRWSFDVDLPTDVGVWPAVWLLGVDACDNPGRCPGYETSDYLELDLVETSGSEPDEIHTSAHWFEGRLRSATASHESRVLLDDADPRVQVHVEFERRPGFLRWMIDGVEVLRLAGPVDAALGPHRPGDLQLVANLAVGGTFAGGEILGPTSSWWGDARAPAGFPDQGWTETIMSIGPVEFVPLGDQPS